jgi:hypothetical protein
VTSYLGLDKKTKPTPGRFHLRTIISSYLLVTSAGLCTLDKVRSRPISETLIGQHIPEWSRNPGLFRTCQDLTLKNGDVCLPGSFLILEHPDRIGETFVGKVEEIIQQVGSIAAHAHGTDGILVQRVQLLRGRTRYGMPSVITSGDRRVYQTDVSVVCIEVCVPC